MTRFAVSAFALWTVGLFGVWLLVGGPVWPVIAVAVAMTAMWCLIAKSAGV